MAFFNAFQLMALFSVMPFLIQWTHNADFYAHNVIVWVLVALYIIGFGSLTALVGENLNK